MKSKLVNTLVFIALATVAWNMLAAILNLLFGIELPIFETEVRDAVH